MIVNFFVSVCLLPMWVALLLLGPLCFLAYGFLTLHGVLSKTGNTVRTVLDEHASFDPIDATFNMPEVITTAAFYTYLVSGPSYLRCCYVLGLIAGGCLGSSLSRSRGSLEDAQVPKLPFYDPHALRMISREP